MSEHPMDIAPAMAIGQGLLSHVAPFRTTHFRPLIRRHVLLVVDNTVAAPSPTLPACTAVHVMRSAQHWTSPSHSASAATSLGLASDALIIVGNAISRTWRPLLVHSHPHSESRTRGGGWHWHSTRFAAPPATNSDFVLARTFAWCGIIRVAGDPGLLPCKGALVHPAGEGSKRRLLARIAATMGSKAVADRKEGEGDGRGANQWDGVVGALAPEAKSVCDPIPLPIYITFSVLTSCRRTPPVLSCLSEHQLANCNIVLASYPLYSPAALGLPAASFSDYLRLLGAARPLMHGRLSPP
ncbi:hypothetical protein DFH06DRAFT_1426677 [Mycena polygramma]|nr:hypothetical protein DFH06DRAFT_1426677 [Mycena polygramma]